MRLVATISVLSDDERELHPGKAIDRSCVYGRLSPSVVLWVRDRGRDPGKEHLSTTATGKRLEPRYRLAPEGVTKNYLRLLVILPLLADLALASELPDAPVRSEHASHRLFLAEVGALTAANAFDGYTTVRDTNWGYSEESFALGKHPGAAKYVAVEGAIEAATVWGAWELNKSRHKPVRMCSHYLLGVATFAHVQGAIHNFRDFNGPLQ